MLLPSVAGAQDCFRSFIGFDPVPVSRSAAQQAMGQAAAERIVPRLGNGSPSPAGSVAFLSIGMSNTSLVWNGVRLALRNEPRILPTLKWVNGAQGGQAADEWANPACPCWAKLDPILANKGETRATTQAVFLMVTRKFTHQDPATNAFLFRQRVLQILDILTERFPHLQIVYLTSNYYGGYDEGQNKTPEPHDYFEGRELQEVQDSYAGRLWVSSSSAYLWADGIRPRWDGLTLLCSDVMDGGVHLSSAGKVKYGRWLLESFMADPTTAGWMR